MFSFRVLYIIHCVSFNLNFPHRKNVSFKIASFLTVRRRRIVERSLLLKCPRCDHSVIFYNIISKWRFLSLLCLKMSNHEGLLTCPPHAISAISRLRFSIELNLFGYKINKYTSHWKPSVSCNCDQVFDQNLNPMSGSQLERAWEKSFH